MNKNSIPANAHNKVVAGENAKAANEMNKLEMAPSPKDCLTISEFWDKYSSNYSIDEYDDDQGRHHAEAKIAISDLFDEADGLDEIDKDRLNWSDYRHFMLNKIEDKDSCWFSVCAGYNESNPIDYQPDTEMRIVLDDICAAVRIHFISLVDWIESEIHNESRQGAFVLYKECLPLEIEYIKKYGDEYNIEYYFDNKGNMCITSISWQYIRVQQFNE